MRLIRCSLLYTTSGWNLPLMRTPHPRNILLFLSFNYRVAPIPETWSCSRNPDETQKKKKKNAYPNPKTACPVCCRTRFGGCVQIFGGRRLFVRYTAPLVDISSKKKKCYRLVGRLLIKNAATLYVVLRVRG